MENKYRIVNTEERLPTEFNQYYTNQGLIDFNDKNGNFWDENDDFELYPNWWLEEIDEPDFSEIQVLLNEFHNDLAKCVKEFKVYHPLSVNLHKIKDLIKKLNS